MKEWISKLDSPFKDVAVLASVVLIAFIGSYIIYLLLRPIKIDKNLNKFQLVKLRRPLFFLLISILMKPAMLLLEYSYGWLDQFQTIFVIWASAWLVIRIVGIGRLVLLGQYDLASDDNLKARKIFTQVRVFERIIVVLIVVVSLGMALMTFESIKQIGVSLLTSAGIAGIIVGLAAQRLISNILAGFQIAITQPIRIDDVVIVENEWGKIEEITLTYVVINIWDKRRLVVPSTYFIEKPFQNWTRTTSELLGTVFLYTDYHMDVDVLRKQLTKILEATPLWDGKVNIIQVTDAKQNNMELRVLVSSKDAPTGWDLRVHVREQLILFLQKKYPEMLPKTRVELNQLES